MINLWIARIGHQAQDTALHFRFSVAFQVFELTSHVDSELIKRGNERVQDMLAIRGSNGVVVHVLTDVVHYFLHPLEHCLMLSCIGAGILACVLKLQDEVIETAFNGLDACVIVLGPSHKLVGALPLPGTEK